MGSGIGTAPASACKTGDDGAGTDIAFADNLLPSPMPPANLDPKNAPQIVVFGFDDVENVDGVTFVNSLIGTIKNPDNSKGSCNLNPNACYAGSSQDACGDMSLTSNLSLVTQNMFDFGNHTIDHLEANSIWGGIPQKYRGDMGGWVFNNGNGPGLILDQATWQTVLNVNDSELKKLYGVAAIQGFRAPRLEVNDQGLLALKAAKYSYDQDLEEILPENQADAAVDIDTSTKTGFNWVPWPYTLDNGSPGIWNQQSTGQKAEVVNYPTGVWEVPVYQVYVPTKGGLGKSIADKMIKADTSCNFPADTPQDQRKHCFLSDGELTPGDVLKEITSFDFNTFIYGRMTPDEWLTIMKNTFMLRYYGNRAPLTYGAHPIQYSSAYDTGVLGLPINFAYTDVLQYTTYDKRQKAMRDFVAWIKADPEFSRDTYFMSATQLVAYMKAPFDKTGAKVTADAVAMPASNGLFSRLTWNAKSSTINVVSGNAADITFKVLSLATPGQVAAGFTKGALKGVSHIDISYNTEVPFRVRLMTADGSQSTTVLLAGVGGDRTARIRMKDFSPAPERESDDVAKAAFVDANYLANVTGIAFESAATPISGTKDFATHIKQITLHGVASADLCK